MKNIMVYLVVLTTIHTVTLWTGGQIPPEQGLGSLDNSASVKEKPPVKEPQLPNGDTNQADPKATPDKTAEKPANKSTPPAAVKQTAIPKPDEVPLLDIAQKSVSTLYNKTTDGGITPSHNKYWNPVYHSQVTREVFALIHYPYYSGGKPFSLSIIEPNVVDSSRETLSALIENPIVDPNLPAISSTPALKPDQAIRDYELCCDLIYQWRNLNESPENALELVRSIELTKTETKIFQTKANLAIGVKRTIGQIGLTNIHFDQTCRIVIQMLMQGRDPRPIMTRMDKQLADLASQYDRLVLQNDQISIALGMGKINRTSVSQNQPVTFINISSLKESPY